MFLHVHQKDDKTIWEIHKSNLTCLAIFVLYMFLCVCVCVCVVAKSPEAAWNGGEIYFLILCIPLLSNKIPTEFH